MLSFFKKSRETFSNLENAEFFFLSFLFDGWILFHSIDAITREKKNKSRNEKEPLFPRPFNISEKHLFTYSPFFLSVALSESRSHGLKMSAESRAKDRQIRELEAKLAKVEDETEATENDAKTEVQELTRRLQEALKDAQVDKEKAAKAESATAET